MRVRAYCCWKERLTRSAINLFKKLYEAIFQKCLTISRLAAHALDSQNAVSSILVTACVSTFVYNEIKKKRAKW
jgi:hypothetical protein